MNYLDFAPHVHSALAYGPHDFAIRCGFDCSITPQACARVQSQDSSVCSIVQVNDGVPVATKLPKAQLFPVLTLTGLAFES